nr:unnamed protein product [Callosobruchus chinensis]
MQAREGQLDSSVTLP